MAVCADLLTDPLSTLTVLAPDDSAFMNAADMLGMDVEDLVTSPVIIPVLLNHIVGLPILVISLLNPSLPLSICLLFSPHISSRHHTYSPVLLYARLRSPPSPFHQLKSTFD